jgi:hypothetical protein
MRRLAGPTYFNLQKVTITSRNLVFSAVLCSNSISESSILMRKWQKVAWLDGRGRVCDLMRRLAGPIYLNPQKVTITSRNLVLSVVLCSNLILENSILVRKWQKVAWLDGRGRVCGYAILRVGWPGLPTSTRRK